MKLVIAIDHFSNTACTNFDTKIILTYLTLLTINTQFPYKMQKMKLYQITPGKKKMQRFPVQDKKLW